MTILRRLLPLLLLAAPLLARGLQLSTEASLEAEVGLNSMHKAELSAEASLRAKMKAERVAVVHRLVSQMDKAASSEVIPRTPKLLTPEERADMMKISKPLARRPSLLGLGAASARNADRARGMSSSSSEFQPSAQFAAQGNAEMAQEEAARAGLPWGIGSPRTGDSLPNFHYSGMPFMDFPKEIEYSLDAGDNIQTFSSAYQDIKLLTQVLFNITNGFYLDTNAAEGEENSNTLLLEILGWRGLCLEPRAYHFARLWSKMRKAWLFLGAVSPHENATKIGFDTDGLIDMQSGHMIHAYPVKEFMAGMGGRKTIDFWNLNNGGYEAEVLNETLLGSGKSLEIGVILVRFDGRRTGRGYKDFVPNFVQYRSKDETEELVFEILHNASYKYIGGLDAYWINYIEPRYHYRDAVFVLPSYFEKRGLPIPWTVKAAPPPELTYPRSNQTWTGWKTWDSGFPTDTEIDMTMAYIDKSKAQAMLQEPVAKAHRVVAGRLLG